MYNRLYKTSKKHILIQSPMQQSRCLLSITRYTVLVIDMVSTEDDNEVDFLMGDDNGI